MPATKRTRKDSDAPAEAPKPATTRRKGPAFGVGDRVVHPQHGAAVITKKVKQTVEGSNRDYYVLEIATDEEAVRSVISKNQTRKVFQIFKEEPQDAGSNWSRWYKVLNEKMTSGDIYQVAEVIRDLSWAQQTKGISPALKRMLSRARLTLISELRFALEVDEEEATRRLDRALPKAEKVEEI
jgi:CarD family transcriptional regulator